MRREMYRHAPPEYVCPFCVVAAGEDNPFPYTVPYTTQSDVVHRDAHSLAFRQRALVAAQRQRNGCRMSRNYGQHSRPMAQTTTLSLSMAVR